MEQGIHIDASNVIDKIHTLESSLICKECHQTMKDPVVIGRCSHTFCRECISNFVGRECPLCKIPVDTKDSYPDRQLTDLLGLLKQLKAIFEQSSAEKQVVSKQQEVKENVEVVLETPMLNGSGHGAALDVSNHNSPEPSKVPEAEPHCENPGANIDVEDNMKTPKHSAVRLRQTLSTPCTKNRNQSPFRLKAFSAKKALQKRLRSPRSHGLFSSSNLEKRNAKGETPLHVAVIKGDYLKAKSLLKEKANPNVKDNAGWTPLHEASNHGFLDIATLLVESGAVVNVPGEDNITPLHDAIINGKMDVACYLASKGGDVNAKTSHGKSALDLCRSDEDKQSLLKAFDTYSKADNVAGIQTPRAKRSKIIFLCTSLDNTQKEKFQKCAQILKAEVLDEFSPEVTHIVTSCDENGQCNRTLKILQGILAGKWIVNFKWVEMCLEYKKKLPEEAFEVPGTKQHPDSQGPKRARENFLKQCPPLFDGCNFYIHGQIYPPMPPKEDVCQLIQLGGGRVLNREPRVETINLEQHLIPYHAADGPLADISNFVLYQDKPPRDTHIRMNHVCTVTVQWFLACISEFRLQEPNVTNKK